MKASDQKNIVLFVIATFAVRVALAILDELFGGWGTVPGLIILAIILFNIVRGKIWPSLTDHMWVRIGLYVVMLFIITTVAGTCLSVIRLGQLKGLVRFIIVVAGGYYMVKERCWKS
jgi:hypothetical protein